MSRSPERTTPEGEAAAGNPWRLFLVGILALFLAQPWGLESLAVDRPAIFSLLYGAYKVIASILAVTAARVLGSDADPLRLLRRIDRRTALRVLGSYLLVFVGILIITHFVVRDDAVQDAVDQVQRADSAGTVFALFVMIVLITPVFEEIVFRGCFFGSLAPACGEIPAVLVTALLFAAVHPRAFFVPIALLGLYLALLRWRLDSLWPSVFVHALHNLVSFALVRADLNL